MSENNKSQVRCVKITGGENFYYTPVLVDRTHPIFNTSIPLPISTTVGWPLLMSRVVENVPRDLYGRNQHATWLNMDPQTGLSPPEWQHSIGDVIVANADRSDLEMFTLRVIVEYVSTMREVGVIGDKIGTRMSNCSRAGLDAMIKRRKREAGLSNMMVTSDVVPAFTT